MVPDGDHPTRTLILTLIGTLSGDLCVDAVGCGGFGLIWPKRDSVDGGCVFQIRAPGCACNIFGGYFLSSCRTQQRASSVNHSYVVSHNW